MKIEKCSYSAKPWRLVTDDGREVFVPEQLDHPDLGRMTIAGPVGGNTKREAIAAALALLDSCLRRLAQEKKCLGKPFFLLT